MAKIDQVLVNGTTYEIVPEIAPLFNESKSYAAGDCVIKDAVLYRFTSAHAAGAWIGTDAEEITVGKELTGLKADLNKTDNKVVTLSEDVFHNAIISGYNIFHVLASTGTNANVSIFDFKVPQGKLCYISVEYGSAISNFAALYRVNANNEKSVIVYLPVSGRKYLVDTTTGINYFTAYIASSGISADTDIKVTVEYTNINNDSLESNILKTIGLNGMYDEADITYQSGVINTVGTIVSNKNYQYSSAIYLEKGDSVIIEDFKTIYRIARYNSNPTIGTTTPDRYVNAESTVFVEDQNSEYIVLMWEIASAGNNPSVLVIHDPVNIIPIATDSRNGLMSKADKANLDYLFERQEVTYNTGAVSSTGTITPNSRYQYCSAIQLKMGDVIYLDGFKEIYRIARYDSNPTIGTTVPNRYVNTESTSLTEDQPSEYVVLTWDTLHSGTNPQIIIYHSGDQAEIPIASTTEDGLMSKEDKQKLNTLHNTTYDVATPSADGLMSKEDKQKLNNIVNPGSITIQGSGVTKNASAYGFLPTNTGEYNSTALQDAVNGGGTILVDYPGTYDVSNPCIIGSDTTIIFGAGVYLNRVTNSSNKTAVYPFVNEGSYTGNYDENIAIIGLHLITNGLGMGYQGKTIYGQRGQLSFANVKNLLIRDFEILDGTDINDYNIHIQRFENITLENIKIISQKDGIHLGKGKRFVIRHGYFITNDDAIALNAHDYPTGTRYLGWIEDGIVEDIVIAREDTYNDGRGLYMLGGSWLDWASGNSYRTYGDAVVSDGRIYRTVGTISADKPTLVSTVQPTHTSGEQTYSDGLTWRVCQTVDVCYDCGVRNVIFQNIHIERTSNAAMTISCDDDRYSRSYYPNSTVPEFENIVFRDVFTRSGAVTTLVSTGFPVKNLRVMNAIYNMASYLFSTSWGYETGVSDSSATFDGVDFNLTNNNKTLFRVVGVGSPTAKCRIGNSLGNYNSITPVISSGITLLSNDIGIS